jgi:hypothetical protein
MLLTGYFSDSVYSAASSAVASPWQELPQVPLQDNAEYRTGVPIFFRTEKAILKGQSHEKFGEMRVWFVNVGHN